jgi:hypothetical protein
MKLCHIVAIFETRSGLETQTPPILPKKMEDWTKCPWLKEPQGCVTPWPLPFTLKKKRILRQKEELWKLKYFTMQKNIIFIKKNPLIEETKILQDIIITL